MSPGPTGDRGEVGRGGKAATATLPHDDGVADGADRPGLAGVGGCFPEGRVSARVHLSPRLPEDKAGGFIPALRPSSDPVISSASEPSPLPPLQCISLKSWWFFKPSQSFQFVYFTICKGRRGREGRSVFPTVRRCISRLLGEKEGVRGGNFSLTSPQGPQDDGLSDSHTSRPSYWPTSPFRPRQASINSSSLERPFAPLPLPQMQNR